MSHGVPPNSTRQGDTAKARHRCAIPPLDFHIDRVFVRHADETDLASLRELFQESILEGMIGDNDTGADIDNLREGYMCDEGASAFWVASFDEYVIGMIGVQKTHDNAAEVRRLRVRDAYRRKGIGTVLMKKALTFCQRQGYLKVVLDVRIERGPAIALFEKFGFTHGRTREINGRKLLDFYIDLYRDPRP